MRFKMRFFICDPPRKIKGAPEDETPACTPHIFAILISRQGMIRGQTSSGGGSYKEIKYPETSQVF